VQIKQALSLLGSVLSFGDHQFWRTHVLLAVFSISFPGESLRSDSLILSGLNCSGELTFQSILYNVCWPDQQFYLFLDLDNPESGNRNCRFLTKRSLMLDMFSSLGALDRLQPIPS
jgi:hypothetical protein